MADESRERRRLGVPPKALADFCRRWHIIELSFFGSVLRDDFGFDSDIDILVTYDATARVSAFDHLRAERELTALAGRPVELTDRDAVMEDANWLRRQKILGSARLLYAA